ncbi:MAG: RNA polymerase sigma factor [Sedimenticolaceae bacterium]
MNNIAQERALGVLTDEQLVGVFQAGGPRARVVYSELARRHRPALVRRCRARLGNMADAEEAVQESLLRAYRGLLRFRRDACLRTWLFAIVDNQCNTLYVRRSRFALSDHLRALIVLHEESYRNPGHEGVFEQSSLVREVLAELPSPSHDVLMLRFYRDLSLEDIAVTLGVGLSAAKMRLYRAIVQFKTKCPDRLSQEVV